MYKRQDNDWPDVIIVSPLLNWSYKDVWNYILSHDVEYCELYKRGYTSIGIKGNTFPNYKLYNNNNKYNHACELQDGDYERMGRIKIKLPITLSGKVVRGKGWGKKILGIPTANLDIAENKLDDGVYMGYIYIKNKKYLFVMSCGINPQFGDKSFEIHIIDMIDDDLYNNILKITITRFIRPMEKYSTIDKLKEAIFKDIKYGKVHG